MNKIKLIHGDCLEKMQELEDKSIDCIISDPPFGVTSQKWDQILSFDELWKQFNRVIKDNGAIIVFGKGIFSAKTILSNEKMYRYSLVWEKGQGIDFYHANKKPLNSHEDIMIFYKKPPTYNPQFWYSEPYKRIKLEHEADRNNIVKWNPKVRFDSISEDGRRYPLSVLKFPKGNREKDHPTQKPVALLEWLIKTYTNENETILDATCGSASTLIAAINTHRSSIGIELEDKYFDLSKKRIENHLSELENGLDFLFEVNDYERD